MRRNGMVLIGLFLCFCLAGQSIEETKNIKPPRLNLENPDYETDSVMKSPVCCFFQENFDCPSNVDFMIFEGTVVVEFTVNEDGNIGGLNIENSRLYKLDQAITDCLNSTNGNWISGTVDGMPVAMRQRFYIRFDAPGNPSHEEIARNHLSKALEIFEKANQCAQNVEKQNRLFRRADFQLAYARRYKPQADDVSFWSYCIQNCLQNQEFGDDRYEEVLSPDGLIAEPEEILYVLR